jgi:phosphoribosyl 1,2-cyclic phosphate phosphodiesterase
MSLRITILGCGSSGGVPRIGRNGWGSCDPQEPKNRRRRCSILVQRISGQELTSLLVDMSPDLRAQLLDVALEHLDGILLTHSHADHLHGIDDVRPLVLQMRKRLDIYMDKFTSDVAHNAFSYIFRTPEGSLYPPLLNAQLFKSGSMFAVDGNAGAIHATPFRVHHGEIDAMGFRFGDVAYSPDLKDIPDESLPHLENLDLWIIDALRYVSHPSHLTLNEALRWIERMKPKKAILTNLHTDMDYNTLCSILPSHVEPAYDGMEIELKLP